MSWGTPPLISGKVSIGAVTIILRHYNGYPRKKEEPIRQYAQKISPPAGGERRETHFPALHKCREHVSLTLRPSAEFPVQALQIN
jgi:hypothetical protein